MKNQTSWVAMAIALGAPLAAAAGADPADPASTAPPLRFQSAFSDYRPWQDIEPGDWRAINESVRGAPGGRAGQEVAPPAVPAPASPASAGAVPQAPGAPGHGGHPTHGGQQ